MSDLLNKASLVMVPSGYKEDTVYSVVPSDGSGDLSFTRASNGTRINSAGLVEVVACNLLTYSSVLSDSSYTISELSRTDSQTDPNGGSTGALFTATSATNASILKSFSTIIGQVYTCFVYLKGNSSGSVSIRVDGAVPAPVNNVNYTTSYQQFTYTFTADSTTSTFIIGGYGTWAGSEAIYVAFPQANIGSTAKPYFPTTDRLNVPRLTYQNGGGGCPSLLLEPQSTNLCLYSEQFDNAAWTKTSGTVTANQAISPDGTQNADKCVGDNGVVTMEMRTASAFSITSGSVYTWSLYVKKAGYRYCQMTAWTNDDPVTVYDLDNGVVVSEIGPSHTSTITSVGNGWYKITITRTASDSVAWMRFTPLASTTGTAQNGTDGFYIWGAQVEASNYATSYIPTQASSATRVADACSKTGISSLIGQSEGVLFVDLQNPSGGDIATFGLNGTNTIFIRGGYDNSWSAGIVANSVYYTFTSVNNSASRIKIAIAYKSGDSVLYINGVQTQQITSAFSFTASLSSVIFNPSAFYFAQPHSATYNQAVIFPTRLTNAELASLTTI